MLNSSFTLVSELCNKKTCHCWFMRFTDVKVQTGANKSNIHTIRVPSWKVFALGLMLQLYGKYQYNQVFTWKCFYIKSCKLKRVAYEQTRAYVSCALSYVCHILPYILYIRARVSSVRSPQSWCYFPGSSQFHTVVSWTRLKLQRSVHVKKSAAFTAGFTQLSL